MDKRFFIFLLAVTFSFWGIRTVSDYYKAQAMQEWLEKHPEMKDKVKEATHKDSQSKKQAPSQPAESTPFGQPSSKKRQPQFYVLENSYQQIVFSSVGGAITEINLPFRNKEDKKSVVLPTEFDRLMQQESPMNDRFPLMPAKMPSGTTLEPKIGGYYPLLRRSSTLFPIAPQYAAFTIVSDYPELAQMVYDVVSFTDHEIIFEGSDSYRRITKRFTLPENPEEVPYCFHLEIKVNGDASGLYLTSGIPEVEWISGGPAPLFRVSCHFDAPD